MKRVGGSFRDPSGQVYEDGDEILRTIDHSYAADWTRATESGLLEAAVQKKWLIPYEEQPARDGSWKTVRVERLPFVSYPYEWCFSQLKDAALLTLALQRLALRHDMIVKDATAFNVQWRGRAPVFIDLLSFEEWVPGEPWKAYRQFCMHFLAPLTLMAYKDFRFARLSELWLDGVPLDLTANLLPTRTWFRFGLASHIHLHSRFQDKYGDARQAKSKVKKINMTKESLVNITNSLASTIKGLRPPRTKTEWAEYYTDTNYTAEAADEKYQYVRQVAEAERGGGLAVDLGANTGRYSEALSHGFPTVVAADLDPMAVESHYRALRRDGRDGILPLVIDLGNPSPSLGWAGRERDSFAVRTKASFLTALALVHHLVITAGIPLPEVASYCAELLEEGGTLILEFVPKEDSQTRRLLAVREDMFSDYSMDGLRRAFEPWFTEVECRPITDSLRTLHRFRKRPQ